MSMDYRILRIILGGVLLLVAAFAVYYLGFPLRGYRWALLVRATGARIAGKLAALAAKGARHREHGERGPQRRARPRSPGRTAPTWRRTGQNRTRSRTRSASTTASGPSSTSKVVPVTITGSRGVMQKDEVFPPADGEPIMCTGCGVELEMEDFKEAHLKGAV